MKYTEHLEISLEGNGALVVYFVRYDTYKGELNRYIRYEVSTWREGLRCRRCYEGVWSDVGEITSARSYDRFTRQVFTMPLLIAGEGALIARSLAHFSLYSDDTGDNYDPWGMRKNVAQIRHFSQSIPPEVINNVGLILYDQLALLQWVAQDQRAYELQCVAPVLLWLLYDVRTNNSQYDEMHTNRELVCSDNVLDQKRRVIFEGIFGWSSRSAIRVLSRIQVTAGSEEELSWIRGFFSSPANLEYVRHMKVIPVYLMSIVLDHGPKVKNKFFCRFFVENYPGGWGEISRKIKSYLGLLEDSRRMITELCSGDSVQRELDRMETKGSLTKLQKIHDRLVVQLNLMYVQKEAEDLIPELGEYPSPPYQGTDEIVPLRSYQQLIDEGVEMEHCVAGYAKMVAKGRCFIYKVISPERATLELKLDSFSRSKGLDHWEVGQLFLSRNNQVSSDTQQAVMDWFNNGITMSGMRKPKRKEYYVSRHESQAEYYAHLL